MSKKGKQKFQCFVCGKKLTQHEVEQDCYQYYDKIACCHHPGIEEWYQNICDKEDLTVLSRPAREIIAEGLIERKKEK